MGATMTALELRDLIVRQLAREHVGGTVSWRRVIGDLRVYARSTHPHCNWDVRPTGTPTEVDRVERMVDKVRILHPFIE
jgi:hypothetical protein